METLRSYVIKNVETNMKNLVSCLCAWSTSTFPLVKSSKFIVPDQNDVHQYTIDVIHNDTMLLVFEILMIAGIEADRPWTTLAEMKSILRLNLIAELKSSEESEIRRLSVLTRTLEEQVSKQKLLIEDYRIECDNLRKYVEKNPGIKQFLKELLRL